MGESNSLNIYANIKKVRYAEDCKRALMNFSHPRRKLYKTNSLIKFSVFTYYGEC